MIRSVAKNTGVILLGNIINKLSSVIILLVFSRYLGAAGFGQFSFVFFYVGLFGWLTDLGIRSIVVRELSRPKVDRELYFGNCILITLAGACAAIMICTALTAFLGYGSDLKFLIYIASFSLIFSFRDLTFRQIYESIFQVELKMAYPTIINALNEVLVVGSCLIVVYFKGTITELMLMYVVAYIPGFLSLISYSNEFIKPKMAFDRKIAADIIKMSLPLGVAVALTTVYDKIGGVLIEWLKGSEEVGYFSVAYRLAISLKIVPLALMTSLFPLLSESFTSARAKFMELFESAVKYVMLLAVPMVVFVFLFPRQIIIIISGRAFLPATTSLIFIICATAVLFMNIVLLYIMIAINKQGVSLLISSVTLAANVLLNLPMINRWGSAGAAATLLVTETIGLLLGLAFVRLYTPEFRFSILIKIGLAAAVTALALLLPLPSIARFAVSLAVFASIVMVLKVFTKKEYKLIRSFVIWSKDRA